MVEIGELMVALVFGMAFGYVCGLCTFQKVLKCAKCGQSELGRAKTGLPTRRKG